MAHRTSQRRVGDGSVQPNHRVIPSMKPGSGQGARKMLATGNREGPTRPYKTIK